MFAAALRYSYLKFSHFCIKIILLSIEKSEITDCDTKRVFEKLWLMYQIFFTPP